MARLFDHSNCPNPVQWGSSPIKTVYVRDTEAGKVTWKPVGWICTGCGVFRSKSGWYPSGKAEPICEPWKPLRPELARALEEAPVPEPEEVEDSAHADDEALEDKPARQPYGSRVRVTTSYLQELLGKSRDEVIRAVKNLEIPVKVDQYRHWSVPADWHSNKVGVKNGRG